MGTFKFVVIAINAIMAIILFLSDCYSTDGGDKFVCRTLMIPSLVTLVYLILN